MNPVIVYFATLFCQARDRLRPAGEGTITVEGMVIAALLFVIALAALLLYTTVVRKYVSEIH